MNCQERKIIGICAGILLALTAGVPAVADDTELLLVTPSTNQELAPNIMFIVDTSTSMESEEETIEPYDSTLSYAGDCDVDRVYWSVIEIVPVCDAANTSYIEQAKFVCAARGSSGSRPRRRSCPRRPARSHRTRWRSPS